MEVRVVDAFDLPDWIGTAAVTWMADADLDAGPHVKGVLVGGSQRYVLDLLAVDAAYPRPVCPEPERRLVQQAWEFGEILLLDAGGRLAAGTPGHRFDPTLVCEAIRRVARSVAAAPGNFTVSLRV